MNKPDVKKQCMTPLLRAAGRGRIHEDKTEDDGCQGLGEVGRMGSYVSHGDRVSDGEDGNVLEMDGSVDCKTM